MKKKLLSEAKATVRKHYVRKKAFDALKKEVRELKKQLARYEKRTHGQSGVAQEAEKAVAEKPSTKKPAPSSVGAQSGQDKLTLIRGIGPVLEKKLGDIGVTRFEQIAGWTAQDIDGFSEQLRFKGRIEREEWVKQAKALLDAEPGMP